MSKATGKSVHRTPPTCRLTLTSIIETRATSIIEVGRCTSHIAPLSATHPVNHTETERDKTSWDLAAETVTVRIRWFGLCVGYVLVNFIGGDGGNRPVLNAILTLGAVYAIIDTCLEPARERSFWRRARSSSR